jgi:hypothetical protein
MPGGYDHNYALNTSGAKVAVGSPPAPVKLAALVTEPSTG